MAKKAPSKKTDEIDELDAVDSAIESDVIDSADAVDPVDAVSAEALISEKMRAGLTRAQAEHVIAAQAEHDHLLAQVATA
jgi:hypothetical protein